MIHALETASATQKEKLAELMKSDTDVKLNEVLAIFQQCKVDEWAKELKEKYLQEALSHLDQISVDASRKEPLKKLALYLIEREH